MLRHRRRPRARADLPLRNLDCRRDRRLLARASQFPLPAPSPGRKPGSRRGHTRSRHRPRFG
eukprot:3325541-Heterocapsa_arctica.AAC.1